MQVGGIVLCGGHSRRMGSSKALLPFGDETMLQRVLRLLAPVVGPLVVVAARDQQLPELPSEVEITWDEEPDRGPLQGIHAGLRALRETAEAAYITSCDVPLLVPAFVETLIKSLDHHQVVVPVDSRFHHPLAAVYRVDLWSQASELLEADQRRPLFLLEQADTLRIPVEQLQAVDPDLLTLQNINHPRDYLAALESCDLAVPPELLSRWHDQLDD
ncbi:MAG: molybdenum cofactor guanylyltransferase [Planctomycetota bacterium]|nr:molybdenum cofactor guanylyltransferase [Planctomycetota bacterium]